MSKNHRQPYSVSKKAGMLTSAASWGTGRAVSRVPRVPGSGTHRSGQGAISNMCRGGRIFSPTTIWRKWHHRINKNQRRQAVVSAIASSGISSLVVARGHNLNKIPEIPLVFENSVELLKKTKEGKISLECVGIHEEIKEKKKNFSIRRGKGKMRNRRFLKYKGPLIIYEKNARCFRNIPTIEICSVYSLDLLKLAPGGHVGRLCVWTHNSFEKLNFLFSSSETSFKQGILFSNNITCLSDLKKIITSSNIQSVIRPIATPVRQQGKKKCLNLPVKNLVVNK
jgi:large subunit ribosomal protein L4e